MYITVLLARNNLKIPEWDTRLDFLRRQAHPLVCSTHYGGGEGTRYHYKQETTIMFCIVIIIIFFSVDATNSFPKTS